MAGVNLSGILPPVTTPFDEGGAVDLGALQSNIARYNETGLTGYVAFGSNGEAVHLSRDERGQVLETIKRSAGTGMTVVAGVNDHSTRAAIEASRQCADHGADALLVITPYYYRASMTAEALRRHFLAVASASPLPLLIYNVPQNTGVVIDSATIASLAGHPNIIGVKDSAGNFGVIAETIRLAPPGFSVLVGNGGVLYPALLMGAVGAVLAVACAAPRACVDLYRAVKDGDHERARDLQTRIAPLSHAVTAQYGIAGLKAALDIAGYAGGKPRLPLHEADPGERAALNNIMTDSGLISDM